uniref:Secreted protein n=1 Tax=Myripristis murdjan TaxID=586833 RepID=A0A667WVW0_9TELE
MLSLTSCTLIMICIVPDLGGFPPSTAVSVSLITDCFSRSKAFCKTNSADILCSPPFCTSREKCSFWLSL